MSLGALMLACTCVILFCRLNLWPSFCDLQQESSHEDIYTDYIRSWFYLYHVRSCLMNSCQEKGDGRDFSSTEMFGSSSDPV